jgi:hypothetical protein
MSCFAPFSASSMRALRFPKVCHATFRKPDQQTRACGAMLLGFWRRQAAICRENYLLNAVAQVKVEALFPAVIQQALHTQQGNRAFQATHSKYHQSLLALSCRQTVIISINKTSDQRRGYPVSGRGPSHHYWPACTRRARMETRQCQKAAGSCSHHAAWQGAFRRRCVSISGATCC